MTVERTTTKKPSESREHKAVPAASDSYVAVVHFHGIGAQRRNEELSRIVDALDVHSYRSRSKDDQSVGMLFRIRARLEKSREETLPDITYIKVNRKCTTDSEPEFSTVRFYEVYWAPLTAGGSPVRDVLVWLLKHTITPIRMLTSNWRSRSRLHRAALFGLWRDKAMSETAKAEDLKRLVHQYNRFEKPAARRKFPKGSFREFIKFLRDEHTGKRNKVGERLVVLSRIWRRTFVLREFGKLAVLLCFALLILWGFLAFVGIMLIALNTLSQTGLPGLLESMGAEKVTGMLDANWRNALFALLGLASVLGVTRLISRYVGDVQFWSTYSETDKKHESRQKILKHGAAVLQHVLADPKCRRVTVLGHSLGSAIAMESLLELGRHNRARQVTAPMLGPIQLEKIKHFITMGSPIDKIHYFFESMRTPYHRFVRIFDDVRGDIGEVPFAKNRKPHIHWINLWDKADLISGPLDSPTNGQMPWLTVDNVEISSFPFPAPLSSHSAYFREPGVISTLYQVIFQNRFAFDEAPRDKRGKPDYSAVKIGPGSGRSLTRLIQIAMLALPVWFLLMLILMLLGKSIVWFIPIFIIMIITAGMVGGGLALNGIKKKTFY